ncbi:MAG: DNA-protecting protein DprA [Phycisphaerae bacterium]|nr:DNA-protecting protein DprA [Phycisphaerae bacterium]
MEASSGIDMNWLTILAADGIGPAIARRLLNGFDCPRRILASDPSEISARCGLRMEAAEAISRALSSSDPRSDQSSLLRVGGRYLLFQQMGYPTRLCNIPDPPTVLRVRGGSLVDGGLCIAVVGTRRCSPYGLRQAARFSSALAGAGITVVSGGARGIDAQVHRSAMKSGGKTVVVMGSGLGHVYPPEHDGLFEEVVGAGGVLVSEHAHGQPPRPGQFPRRNRIVSGLSIGVLVIEAPRRSGAMITARMSLEDHGGEAWAVPGSVERPHSSGCHEAISNGWAALVDSPDTLLQCLEDQGWLRQVRSSDRIAGQP